MKYLILAAALSQAAVPALAQDTLAPDGASVYFVNLQDGAMVSSPVKVSDRVDGGTVAQITNSELLYRM